MSDYFSMISLAIFKQYRELGEGLLSSMQHAVCPKSPYHFRINLPHSKGNASSGVVVHHNQPHSLSLMTNDVDNCKSLRTITKTRKGAKIE